MTIRTILSNNVGLKVTALFLALLVWIIISGKERTTQEKTFECNVEFLNIAEKIDVNSRPEQVRINVRGTSREIERIPVENFKLKIDLSGITQSTSLNLLAEDYLEIPEGIKYEDLAIHPKMISITIKEFMSKSVIPKVRYVGKLPNGVILTSRKIVPENVRIYGYKSQIQDIDFVSVVEDIQLKDITESTNITLKLKKSEEILRFENTNTIEVQLTVENKNKKKEENGKQ